MAYLVLLKMETVNTLADATEYHIKCLQQLERKIMENGKQAVSHPHYNFPVEDPINLREGFASGAKIFQQQSENSQQLY